MERITCFAAAKIPSEQDNNTSRSKHCMSANAIPWRRTLVATVTVTVILMSAGPADSFSSFAASAASSRESIKASCMDILDSKAKRQRYSVSTRLYNLPPKDDGDVEDLSRYDPEVAAQIRKARQLVRESKLKMEKERKAAELAATVNGDTNGAAADRSKEEVADPAAAPLPFFAAQGTSPEKIKSKTKGGVIADGEKMASLSKSESWEKRSLSQMFAKEKRIDFDGKLVENDEGKAIADKDVAMAIFNLRKQLQNDDFKKVFNSRNPFIGEVE